MTHVQVSTTTNLTAKLLSPLRGKKTRMPSERSTPLRRKLPRKFPSSLSRTSSLQTRFVKFSKKYLEHNFQVQNRILGNIAGERLAYEACEIYMNETAPNELSADEIRAEIFEVVKKAITADE